MTLMEMYIIVRFDSDMAVDVILSPFFGGRKDLETLMTLMTLTWF